MGTFRPREADLTLVNVVCHSGAIEVELPESWEVFLVIPGVCGEGWEC